jgi:hypothetical protein
MDAIAQVAAFPPTGLPRKYHCDLIVWKKDNIFLTSGSRRCGDVEVMVCL